MFLLCVRGILIILHSSLCNKLYVTIPSPTTGSGRVNLVPLPSVVTSPRDVALAAVICSALATVVLALLVLCVIYCKRQLLEKKPSGESQHLDVACRGYTDLSTLVCILKTSADANLDPSLVFSGTTFLLNILHTGLSVYAVGTQ